MMFGNVAPAPVSFTWATAGVAGAARAARAASTSQRVCVITGVLSGLEGELRLKQGLRPREVGRGRGVLVVEVVPVGEYPQLGVDLIGHAADETRQAVPTHGRGHGVDARDHRCAR